MTTEYQYETVQFHQDKQIGVLTLNRPDLLNCFNTQMHEEVREVLATVSANDQIRALLITGAGRAFCAGQDLSERKREPGGSAPDLGESIEKRYTPLIKALYRLEKPVICAVNGVAAGAGANIALACDIVLAARSACFIQAFSKIGLIPDCGGTWFLPRILGTARAMGLALTAQKLSAKQAEEWGLIWRCVDDEQLAEDAVALAHNLSCQPTYALGLIKRAIHLSSGNTLPEQLDLERDYQRLAGLSDDYQEGVSAFIEKRKPNFSGC